MFNPKYTYLLLDLAVIFFPFVLSFDKKVAFYKTWKSLLLSILIVGAGFILWDIIFTSHKIWVFNPAYVMGIYFFGLPIEECLFFVFVPYSTVFIYACVRAYFKKYYSPGLTKTIHWLFILINVVSVILGYDKTYTLVNSCIALLVLFYLGFVVKWKQLDLFYLAYTICLLPFAICNGILTSWPILIYNDNENLGIRMRTIPFEDLFYNFTMIILWCYFYEKFRYMNKPHENA